MSNWCNALSPCPAPCVISRQLIHYCFPNQATDGSAAGLYGSPWIHNQIVTAKHKSFPLHNTSYTILYIVGWVIFNFFANFDMRYKAQENYFQKLIDFGPKRHSRETFNVRIFKNHRGPQKRLRKNSEIYKIAQIYTEVEFKKLKSIPILFLFLFANITTSLI